MLTARIPIGTRAALVSCARMKYQARPAEDQGIRDPVRDQSKNAPRGEAVPAALATCPSRVSISPPTMMSATRTMNQ